MMYNLILNILIIFTLTIIITAAALDLAQKLNARERAAMRRDILKEQKAVVTNMGSSLDGLKSEIDGFSLQSQQFGNHHNYFHFHYLILIFLFFNLCNNSIYDGKFC